jgi:hypothetical protein
MLSEKILNIIIICTVIALTVNFASAESPPNFPVYLSGDVNIDGKPAPVGTTIIAKVGDSPAGATKVLVAGTYGETANGKLPVSASADGANVDFYVNGIKATLSTPFTYNSNDAGKIFQVSLKAQSSNSGSKSSSGTTSSSGGSTGGMGTISDKKTPTSTTKQGEGLTNAPGEPEAASSTTTREPVSPPFEFSSILKFFVVVVIGAIIFVVLKKTGKI